MSWNIDSRPTKRLLDESRGEGRDVKQCGHHESYDRNHRRSDPRERWDRPVGGVAWGTRDGYRDGGQSRDRGEMVSPQYSPVRDSPPYEEGKSCGREGVRVDGIEGGRCHEVEVRRDVGRGDWRDGVEEEGELVLGLEDALGKLRSVLLPWRPSGMEGETCSAPLACAGSLNSTDEWGGIIAQSHARWAGLNTPPTPCVVSLSLYIPHIIPVQNIPCSHPSPHPLLKLNLETISYTNLYDIHIPWLTLPRLLASPPISILAEPSISIIS